MKRGSHSAAAGRRCTAARWCVHLPAWGLKLHKHSELKMTDSKKRPALGTCSPWRDVATNKSKSANEIWWWWADAKSPASGDWIGWFLLLCLLWSAAGKQACSA